MRLFSINTDILNTEAQTQNACCLEKLTHVRSYGDAALSSALIFLFQWSPTDMINIKFNGDLAMIQMYTKQRESGTWQCADSTESPFAPIKKSWVRS